MQYVHQGTEQFYRYMKVRFKNKAYVWVGYKLPMGYIGYHCEQVNNGHVRIADVLAHIEVREDFNELKSIMENKG